MTKLTVDITCPNCQHKFQIKLADMVPGHTKQCPCACGYTIEFTGDDGRKAQKALDDFTRTLKRLKFT